MSVLSILKGDVFLISVAFVAGGLLWARVLGYLSKIPLLGKLVAKIPTAL